MSDLADIFADFGILGLAIFAMLVVIGVFFRNIGKIHIEARPRIVICLIIIVPVILISIAILDSIHFYRKDDDYKCPSKSKNDDIYEITRSDTPYFMKELLTEIHLMNKTKQELDIIRNEIYARHGIGFSKKDLRDHFCKFPWYNPQYPPNTTPSWTDIQSCNAVFIREYQVGYRGEELKKVVNKIYPNRCNY